MTLAAYLDAFLADLERQARPNTVSAYRSDLALAAQHLTMPPDQIGLNDVVTFLSTGDVSAATIARRVASLKRFFAWAVQQGLCTTNPLSSYRGQHHIRRLPRPIHSRRDLDALDAAVQQAPPPFRLIFTILCETGMRVGEVLALDVGDVVLTRGREGLRIRAPKNSNERIAFLGSDFTPRSLRVQFAGEAEGRGGVAARHHAEGGVAPGTTLPSAARCWRGNRTRVPCPTPRQREALAAAQPAPPAGPVTTYFLRKLLTRWHSAAEYQQTSGESDEPQAAPHIFREDGRVVCARCHCMLIRETDVSSRRTVPVICAKNRKIVNEGMA